MNIQEYEYWKLRQQIRAQKDKRRKRESYARKQGWGLGFLEENWNNAPTMAQFRKMTPARRQQTINDWTEIIKDRNEQFEGRLANIKGVKSLYASNKGIDIKEVDKMPKVSIRAWVEAMQGNVLGYLKNAKVADLMDYIKAMDLDATFKDDFIKYIQAKLDHKGEKVDYDDYFIKTSPEQIMRNIDYYKMEFLQFTNAIGEHKYDIIDGRITLVDNTMG